MVTSGCTYCSTVIVMLFELTVAGDAHERLEVSVQLITSPFTSVLVVYVATVAPPMFTPFFFHWYAGTEPPFVMDEVKVTLLPAQIVVADVLMVIVGTGEAVTVIVTGLEVAVAGDAQVAFEVNTQVNTSLFAIVAVV